MVRRRKKYPKKSHSFERIINQAIPTASENDKLQGSRGVGSGKKSEKQSQSRPSRIRLPAFEQDAIPRPPPLAPQIEKSLSLSLCSQHL